MAKRVNEMSSSLRIASMAEDNIKSLLADMFEGGHENNEVALGVLLRTGEEIQVQLKVTRNPSEFIETEYNDWEASHLPIDDEFEG